MALREFSDCRTPGLAMILCSTLDSVGFSMVWLPVRCCDQEMRLLLQVSPPLIGTSDSLQMMVSNLDYDQHKGRLAIGRVTSGSLRKGQTVAIAKPGTLESECCPASSALHQ